MALSDYYLCDVCEGKALYDADIPDRWEQAGEVKIICKNCARTHRVMVMPKASLVQKD